MMHAMQSVCTLCLCNIVVLHFDRCFMQDCMCCVRVRINKCDGRRRGVVGSVVGVGCLVVVVVGVGEAYVGRPEFV